MLSIIQMKCPHCGASGQVVIPPAGAILIGPCPQCSEMVGVFCGAALALDKHVILQGTAEERYEHLMRVLSAFIEERVGQIVDELAKKETDRGDGETTLHDLASADRGATDDAISDEERTWFIESQLPHIDSREYFNAVFRHGSRGD